MRVFDPKAGVRSAGLFLLLAVGGNAAAQKTVHCPDGDHLEIDINQIEIQYDTPVLVGTLRSLSILTAHFEVARRKLQEADAATQQWDAFLKGLVEGYNRCAITRQQYAEGLNRIYPRLKGDAAGLEDMRKLILQGQRTDAKRLLVLLDSYYDDLRRFAQVSGKEIVLERIEALSEQVASSEQTILTGQQQILERERTGTDAILTKLNEIEQRNRQAPVPTPTEVGHEISGIRKALLAKADEAEVAYQKGYALLNQYRFREAVPFLQQAVAAVPLPDFYLALGRAYWGLWELARAESAFREGMTHVNATDGSHKALLAALLGSVLFDEGNMDEAISELREAIRIKRTSPGPHYALGVALHRKGNLTGAIAEEQEAIRLKPDYADAHEEVGAALGSEGDFKTAIAEERQAIALKPDYAEAHAILGWSLGHEGEWDAMIVEEKEAIRLNPDFADAHYNLGTALGNKGDLSGAIAEERKAISLKPGFAEAHAILGWALGQEGQWNLMISEEQEAIRLKPDFADAHYNLGTALANKGNFSATVAEDRKAIRLRPDYAEAYQDLGAALGSLGDLDGAIAEERKAIRLKPGLTNAYCNLGVLFERKGDRLEALAEYREGHELHPNNAALRAAYGRLTKELGR